MTVIAIAGQRRPQGQRIADRRRRVRLAREFCQRDFEPVMQGLEQRTSSCLANLFSFVGWPSTNLILYRVQSRYPLQSFPGQGRTMSLFQIMELATTMRPACHLLN